MNYKPTIGLEIHAELNTETKMFCSSRNDPNCGEPNVNICPVCMGHPGTLPTINKRAVESVLRVGMALGGELANYTEFDRKNYFYPDLPKGYQISQYEFPLVKGGELNGVAITRVHLEEDTARLQHSFDHDCSLIDFNRAGVPLMELVTEPVLESGEQAGAFAKELQLLLRYLDVSSANMEKGEMRVEANISISFKAEVSNMKLGTKVEVKNLNSIRAVRGAIAYEVERQGQILDSGEEVTQETRGWDDIHQRTFSQRKKESSHDYRYFPEPDLPKLIISQIPEFSKDILREKMPELPRERRERYERGYKLKSETSEILTSNIDIGRFFDRVAELLKGENKLIERASNYLTADIIGLASKSDEIENISSVLEKITPYNFVELMRVSVSGRLSSRGVKDVLKEMVERGGKTENIIKDMGLEQVSDDNALKKAVTQIIEEHAKAVADYKAGKQASLQFLVGQAMKATNGAANPEILRTIFEDMLKVDV